MDKPYCVATFRDYRSVNTPNGDEYQFVDDVSELSNYDDVINYLKDIYERYSTQIADTNADSEQPENLSTMGVFCSRLVNRYGGEAEFALGRQYCLFMRLKPEPMTWYKNGPRCEEVLDFYLHGWNHTQFLLHELAPRDECLAHLKNWLETGDYPEDGG
jgi:hypothetical protein